MLVLKISITASTKLSEDEINKKVREAEQFAQEDKKKKEIVETKNNAESLIYQTEKTLKDLEGKISEEEKSSINAKIEDLKSALTTDNVEDIKAKNDALTQEFYKISEKLYQNANPQGQGAEQKKDDVVDADYEVVDEDENK